MSAFLVTIGLEVHVQLKTRSKMFCACPVEFGSDPNENTCPTCLGLPGALPVLNKEAIEKTILTGLMLECRIPEVCKWDRKNYFYPDMPKNYQLTQFDQPVCIGGGVPLYDLAYPKDAQKSIDRPGLTIKLNRIHLEEDVAKSTHHETLSSIDFNRAGTPLMEIVSEAEIQTAEEAVAYLNSLRQILVYGGVSDADMEKGQMRCDVNISVRPDTQSHFNPKIELKNLNSVSAVRRAIHFEIERQTEDLKRGVLQIQSTRRWDDDLGETQIMRTKEDAHDYRYFPDPDLLPVRCGQFVPKILPLVPELPHVKRRRFVEQYQVSEYDAGVLASDQTLARWFEQAAKDAKSPKRVANWVLNDLLSTLNTQGITLDQASIQPEALRDLTNLIEAGTISNAQGKEVFAVMLETSRNDPAAIAKEKGFEQVSDTGALDSLIDAVMAEFPEKVAEVKAGNDKVVNWLNGQVLKRGQGKLNPKLSGDRLRERILG